MKKTFSPFVAFWLLFLIIACEVPTDPMFPDAEIIVDIVDFLEWRDATIVYDSSLSWKKKNELVAMFVENHMGIITLELPASGGDAISSILSTIHNTTISTILLCLRPGTTKLFLKQAKDVNMLHPKYQWLVTGTGPDALALEQLLCCTPSNVALVIPVTQQPDACDKFRLPQDPLVSTDKFTIYSYDLKTIRFSPVASWSEASRLKVFYDVIFLNLVSHFTTSKLRVGLVTADPFTQRLDQNGTVRYQGICMDILNELAFRLNFSYVILEPEDGLYGVQNDNGSWNGLVAMILRGEIDLGIGPITITTDRKTVVDFTVPYMEDGGGILTKKEGSRPDLMNVFHPFAPNAWFLIATATVVTAAILYFIIKVSSRHVVVVVAESSGPPPQKPPWTFPECLSVIYGSVVNQGAARHPESTSGRVVLGFWWVFAILVGSIYTARLASLLTVRVEPTNINSIQDLAASPIKPIVLEGSSWWQLFMKADTGTYGTIGRQMITVAPTKIDVALKAVSTGQGAYVTDVNQVRYIYGQDCLNLHVATNVFSNNGLAFAMPKNAPYKKPMDYIILKLQEGGFMEAWKKLWWKTSPECGAHTNTLSPAENLQVLSIGGILIVYGIIIGLALLTHLLQWLLPHLACLAEIHQWLTKRRLFDTGEHGAHQNDAGVLDSRL
ncbi:glutamate receptor ionotropic, kainate 3-like [Babylonia areolata]|uniref:glutamate receptor ionotropic, kainate 3-like n=1 Tax=Babylonia areolata TaxID=304850 RepID=UPI003FD05EF5